MAESRLYQNALASLGDRRADWDTAAQRIAAVTGPDPRNQSGSVILANIQTEEQLSSDPSGADPAIMKDALASLNAATWSGTPVECRDAYERALEPFRLKGGPIRSFPTTLHRYINGHWFLRSLCEALADAGQDRLADGLRELVDAAAAGLPTPMWEDVIAYVQRNGVWAGLIANPVPLALPGRSMFLTFDLAAPADRSSAAWLHAALAMPLDREPCFLELRYPVGGGDKLLFPTFPDAGWFHHFRGAAAGEPHGWTRPHPPLDPARDRQPEAVQETQKLDRLPSPGHLRALPP